MQFEFTTSSRIIFGPGSFNSLGRLARDIGKRILLLYGGPDSNAKRAYSLLSAEVLDYTAIRIEREPTVEIIRELADSARSSDFDLIIGLGGGSSLDSAKAISALVTNPGDITDYLEVIGANKQLSIAALPLIAIPTTAGTGSEVTKNAVIGSTELHIKVSLRSAYLLPKIALIDPELTITLPPEITTSTGLDALTQLIEAYTCNIPNPITDALALEGIQRAVSSIYQVFHNGNDIQARENMSLASLLSGISLANAKLGAVHGLAGPIGGEIDAPHGAICASILPYVFEANYHALVARAPDNPVLERYSKISKILTGDKEAGIPAGIQWVYNFCLTTRVSSLSSYGLKESNFNSIIKSALMSSSMKGNPITLSEDELRNILHRVL